MSQYNSEGPRNNGLSIRRVTRYMALLAKELDEQGVSAVPRKGRKPDYQAPAIPDPWDLEKIARESSAPSFSIPRTLPSSGEQEPEKNPEPSAATPAEIAVREKPAGEEDFGNIAWEQDTPARNEILPWDLPEEPAEDAPIVSFPSTQEQDDFARAMMALSSNDDFLVTGVGKRTESTATPSQARHTQSDAPRSRTERPEKAVASRPDRQITGKPEAPGSKVELSIKRILLVLLVVLLLAALGIGAWYFITKGDGGGFFPGGISASLASVVYLGDVNLGCAPDGEALEALLESERLRVETETRLPAVLNKPLRIEKQAVDMRYVAPQADMEKALLEACDVLVEASGVYVDGRLVAVARSELDVNALMEEALAPYRELSGKREILELRFSETVEVKPLTASPLDVMDRDSLRKVLVTGEQEAQEYYEVESGDSLIAIANRYEMQLGQLRYANPDLIGKDLILVGQKLSLTPPKGLLTVQFTERVTEEIALPFETITKTSSSLYTTQTEVEKKGSEGLREVVADVTYIAGVFTNREILQETVIREPEARVVVKGTKKVTNASGSSTYIWPTQGKISSTYKMRWGKQHQGIDIAASTGTPIYAARDGKVTFSGTSGSYGKLIKIDHGGGVETRYAHCSVLKVSSGATVKKGQLIALVGSTGNSTGPHLHFEIRVGGEAKDPQAYLPK